MKNKKESDIERITNLFFDILSDNKLTRYICKKN